MPATKRKASGKQKQSDTKAKQSKQDGQKAVSHDVDVPLDEGFHGQSIPCSCEWARYTVIATYVLRFVESTTL